MSAFLDLGYFQTFLMDQVDSASFFPWCLGRSEHSNHTQVWTKTNNHTRPFRGGGLSPVPDKLWSGLNMIQSRSDPTTSHTLQV